MYKFLLVGVGGFFGAMLRYLLGLIFHNTSQDFAALHGTLAINVIGCFLIGALTQIANSQLGLSSELKFVLIIGLLGSFTTYSTFINETVNHVQSQNHLLAFANVLMHLVLGLSAVFIGQIVILKLGK